MRRILLVEANDVARGILEAAAAPLAQIESHTRFETARARLAHAPFDFIVTNLRLGAYNGLHLAYVNAKGQDGPKVIVYSDEHDAGLARVGTAGPGRFTRWAPVCR